jgi:hypothetical protein
MVFSDSDMEARNSVDFQDVLFKIGVVHAVAAGAKRFYKIKAAPVARCRLALHWPGPNLFRGHLGFDQTHDHHQYRPANAAAADVADNGCQIHPARRRAGAGYSASGQGRKQSAADGAADDTGDRIAHRAKVKLT